MFPKPAIMFDKIRLVREWPAKWLIEAKPGMVFVLPGTVGLSGGVLCVTDTGIFINVDKDQLYNEKPIEWPGVGPGATAIQIVGTEVIIK